ncbi:MAG: LAO/AO transport system kinase [Cyclobacteriaceae bacterium]|jgi:LAO/AO transport system kinase
MNHFGRTRVSLDELYEGILQHDRLILSKAITIIESRRADDIAKSVELLDKIAPYTGGSVRIGITGVPGVGKSSFIETLGLRLANQNHRLAVLSVDPSSARTGGSILGDKTRMEKLSHHSNAFIRPSPAGNSLGGVHYKTRETILLCEAAGFDTIIVETVGVGQSETAVKDMVDCFLLLMLSGGGDELQGIKRGIMEMADIIAINKADSDNIKPAQRTRKMLQNAIHLFPPHDIHWVVPVLLCSALQEKGITEIWKSVESFISTSKDEGFFKINRQTQNAYWFEQLVNEEIRRSYFDQERMNHYESIKAQIASNELGVRKGLQKLFGD